MSKNKKKKRHSSNVPNNDPNKVTVNDIMDEFFPEEDGTETESGNDISEEISADVPDTKEASEISEETEEEIITEEDDTDETLNVVTEYLIPDRSEAGNADIIVKGDAEWDIEEMAENIAGISETFEKSASEDAAEEEKEAAGEEDISGEENIGNSDGNTESTEENEGNDTEMTEKGPVSPDIEPNSENGADVNEKFIIRILKGIIPWKGDSIFEIIRKIIFIAAVAVFIGAGIMLASTLLQSKQAVQEKAQVQEIITTAVVTTIDENGNVITVLPTKEEIKEHNFNVAEHFKNINEDYVGYLEIEGCDIYEPIMQGKDNDYYLTHNYYGGTNKAGTVFMDYRCSFTDEYISPNVVIYGHNQEDGTMFGNLKNYKQDTGIDFYRENFKVKFSTESETYEYLIYGFFVTSTLENQDRYGEVFHYHDYIETLKDPDTFNWYIKQVQDRNRIISPVDVKYGDKLLCLSTCSNEFSNSRFVVFARMLREDETAEDYDFSKAYFNPNARGVDWEAIMSGETTTESDDESETEEPETEETEEEETEETEEETETTVTAETVSETKATTATLSRLEQQRKDAKTSTTPKTSPPETEETSDTYDGSDSAPAETAPPENETEETETATVS